MTCFNIRPATLAAVLCTGLCTYTWAQPSELPNPLLGWRGAELYTSNHHLSAGYGEWREVGVRGIYEFGQHQIAAEVASMNRFNEDGTYAGLSDTVVLSPDWYASVGIGGGNGAAYLPRYRADAFIHRKLLADKNLIASLGVGRYHAPDGHEDNNISLGGTLYFEQPWILQAEVKRTHSQPGQVGTTQYFMAATWGRHKQTLLTGRYGWGEEGYLSLGSNGAISQFSSHQTTLTMQHWVGANWGVKVSAENYHNPYYRRDGILLAVFRDLP